MTLRKRINVVLVVAASTLIAAVSASAGGPLVGGSSAPDHGTSSTGAALKYFIDNERDTGAATAHKYFIDNERDTGAAAAHKYFIDYETDAAAYAGSRTGTTSSTPDPSTRADGFNWTAAGVGASSVVLLALLVTMSVLAARHLRSRPMTH